MLTSQSISALHLSLIKEFETEIPDEEAEQITTGKADFARHPTRSRNSLMATPVQAAIDYINGHQQI